MTRLKVKEILDLAVRIEQNGREFYRRAAAGAADAGVRMLLTSLAQWEDSHCDAFAQLGGDGHRQALRAPEGQLAGYFDALVAEYPFLAESAESRLLRADATAQEVLTFARRMEQATVLFYAGVSALADGEDRRRIDAILLEEMEHVSLLAAQAF
jgi:rubrerythrin